jgi:transcriptional regulator with XRE-family HTH domain
MNVVYNRVKELIEDTGLTVSAFARKLGEDRQRIENIRSKKFRVPEEIMIKIVERFNVNPSWILTGEGPIYSHELPKRHPDEGVAVMPVGVKYARLDNEDIAVTPVEESKGPTYFHDLCNKKMPVNEGIAATPVDTNTKPHNEENAPVDLKGVLGKLKLIGNSTHNLGADSIPIDFKWIWGKLNDEQRKELTNRAKEMIELNEIKKFMNKFAISLEDI